VAEAVAMIQTEPGLDGPDLEVIFAPVPFLDHGFTVPPGHGFTIGGILLQPASKGTIKLASADPTVSPEIDPNYLDDPADMKLFPTAGDIAGKSLQAPALAPHVGEPMRPAHWPADTLDMENLIRQYAETLYHPVGTARMGTDDESVVDESLRVRGVTGL